MCIRTIITQADYYFFTIIGSKVMILATAVSTGVAVIFL